MVDFASRESWRSLIEDLPQDVPLNGVVHLLALDGHGPRASTDEIAQDVKKYWADRTGGRARHC